MTSAPFLPKSPRLLLQLLQDAQEKRAKALRRYVNTSFVWDHDDWKQQDNLVQVCRRELVITREAA